MKITVFGLTLSSSWGNGHATPYRAILRALHGMGHRISFFERDQWFYARHRDFSSCEYCDLVLYSAWNDVRERALRCAQGSDLVITASFLPEGARINDAILNDVSGAPGPIKAYYDLDTPITLSKWRAGGTVEYVRPDQVPGFDLVLSFTGGGSLHELTATYRARRATPIYGCVDPDTHYRVAVPEQYRCAFSYMGTYAPDRQRNVDALFLTPARLSAGETFLLAGSMYPWDGSIAWPENVRRFEHVSPGDHAALYSSSRATLNLTRAEMANSGHCPSGRLFEAAACGTPVVSDVWKGLGDFFRPGDEILTVRSTEDVLQCLRMRDLELERIASRARERTLDEHTGAARAKELLSAVASAGERARSEVA